MWSNEFIKSQKYISYEARLSTFENWSLDNAQIQAELAEVGFWYIGIKDFTQCFSCELILSDWNPEDCPLKQHEYWSPGCEYLKRKKGNHVKFPKYKSLKLRSSTFDILPELTADKKEQLADAGFFYNRENNETLCFHCGTKLPDWEKEDKPWNKHFEFSSKCGHLENNSMKFIKFPNYQSYKSRLDTFDTWPTSKPQTKEQLAEAGLFYDESSDRTCCFCCGEDLKNWNTNDIPWLKHYNSNRACKFVIKRQNLVLYRLYENIESRLNTFDAWPASKSKMKESLAKAGFFYIREEDAIKCFHCGLELQDWKMECDPKMEHIKRFYMCGYFLQTISE